MSDETRATYYWEAARSVRGGQFVAASDAEARRRALSLRSDLEVLYREDGDQMVIVLDARLTG